MGLSVPYENFLDTANNGYGLIVLPINIDDCVRYEVLPFPDKQHRDPFDRMIITHALRDGLALVGIAASNWSWSIFRCRYNTETQNFTSLIPILNQTQPSGTRHGTTALVALARWQIAWTRYFGKLGHSSN